MSPEEVNPQGCSLLWQVLQRVGTDTLVTHEVTTASPGNLVGQRDFVSVRHRVRRDTATYLVGTATHAKLLPSQEGCIRYSPQKAIIMGNFVPGGDITMTDTTKAASPLCWLWGLCTPSFLPYLTPLLPPAGQSPG